MLMKRHTLAHHRHRRYSSIERTGTRYCDNCGRSRRCQLVTNLQKGMVQRWWLCCDCAKSWDALEVHSEPLHETTESDQWAPCSDHRSDGLSCGEPVSTGPTYLSRPSFESIAHARPAHARLLVKEMVESAIELQVREEETSHGSESQH